MPGRYSYHWDSSSNRRGDGGVTLHDVEEAVILDDSNEDTTGLEEVFCNAASVISPVTREETR